MRCAVLQKWGEAVHASFALQKLTSLRSLTCTHPGMFQGATFANEIRARVSCRLVKGVRGGGGRRAVHTHNYQLRACYGSRN